ncbi:hypothetical protein TrST_g9163 [Triparma strigata]|uniref:WW domain-containing protein n=1 Tax=Triparma strigata TaxID=1606541 RepID=A0A9W7F387_9STRA|nr:hypothetical protein TrST_g9163 [Triparma strigata]
MAQVTPVTKHPNEDDVRDFAIACQIDPLFDDKYMPMINSAVHSAMPEGWKIKIDPDDKWYFIHTNVAGVPTKSTWEHPNVEAVRDEVQENIAADEKRERLMMEALNPVDPEEAAAKKRRQDKRSIVNSVELVTLELKKEFGSPEVEDIKMNKNYPGFFSCDPFEVRHACEALHINTNAIKDRRYVWMARMAVLGGIPEGWVRGEDKEIKGKMCRQYRDSSWENEELYVTETPFYKYWKNVIKYARNDDAAEDTAGGRIEVVFDWNMFVKPKTGRSYTFNFIEGFFTFDDGGEDDVVEEVAEVEEVEEEEEEEQESVLEALLLAQILLNPVYTMKDILTFAKQCKIPATEVEGSEKLSSFLKNELMKALPDTWERCVNPDGKVHYYDEPRKISMRKHPRADGIRIRHEKIIAKRKKMLLEARIKERQDEAMKKAVEKTGQHVKNARLVDLNREKTEQSKMHFSHLDPEEEAIVYYRSRFGRSGGEFLVDSVSYILDMMQEEAKEVECSPAQVVQMAIFFGIKPSEEPHLLCIAMCAVLAPLPPFWYVQFDEKSEESDENNDKTGGRRESVKSIDFSIGDNGSAHFVTKEEELSPLVFARDVDETTTHKQVDHPSDIYWRQIAEESREAGKQLSEVQKLRCSILPFFNDDVKSGNRLYYYDFKNGKPIFANSKGNFVSSNIAHFKNLTLPKSVGGETGFYEKKARKKSVKRNAIYKYKPKRELKVMKLNVSSPSFLPPIPRGHLEGVQEEDGMDGIAAAERFLLSEMERLGEGEGDRPVSYARPRTKQDLRGKGGGSLFVGFSGMQRPLAVAAGMDTIEGRGATPWMDRSEGDSRNDYELDFMLAGSFKYESSGEGVWASGAEYVWPEEV